MKIPIALRRRLNVRLIIYLDNILVMGSLLEEIMMTRDTLIFVLKKLGVVMNFQKSVLYLFWQTTGDLWTTEGQKNHINILQLKAAKLIV